MAKSVQKQSRLYIKVIWGRATLCEYSCKFRSAGKISVGRGFSNNLRSPVWPLPDSISLFERESGRVYLNSEIPWQGIIVSGADTQILRPKDGNSRDLEIKNNTYASLRFEGVTIAIRVGAEPTKNRTKIINSTAYRSSVLGLIADAGNEKISLAAAVAASLFVIGATTFGLKSRPIWRPQAVEEIPSSFRLPFISPTHFSTAPDIIQDRLDRFNFLNSVSHYYSDFSSVLTDPNFSNPRDSIFSETAKQYKSTFRDQSQDLERIDASIGRLARETKARNGFLASIPMVRGESLDGSLQRVLDKIDTVATSAKVLVETRALAGDAFKNDPTYDYGKAGGSPGKDSFAEFTKKLGDGYRRMLPDEEQQKLEAKTLAVEASASQIALFGSEHLRSSGQNCCGDTIALKAGVTPIVYADGSQDLARSDENMAALKASTWGAPSELLGASKIQEPMTGVIDSKAVEKTISNARFQLQLCFELALRRNQSSKGNMEWKWRINTQGSISDLTLMNSTLKDEELIHCVRKKIAAWTFPKPKGGSVEVQYPFEFIRDRG